jgi:hypothetical protein
MLWKRGNDHRGSLDRPHEVTSDAGAVEVLSAWLKSDGRNTVALRPDAFPDPAMWGLLLADIARHVANALHEAGGDEAMNVLGRIREGIIAELDHPTDAPLGRWTG